ncbi:MAG: PrsW family intramembrane metalloprotease [Candidatus Liptonbacteria bacterium]|nr:PrsW family intramembrane metalloprotease [Candidatus Liptonbacteria bacterium]
MQIFSLIFAFLPGFAWLLFYLQEDLHPEPKKLIILTFVMGMFAAFFALGLELLSNSALVGVGIAYLSVSSLFIMAFIEEATKFFAAYLAIHKSKSFDEPVDAMMYAVIAALGFATVENIGVLTGGGGGNELALVSGVFATTSLRFIGATLLHSLTSGIVGYFWAMGIREFRLRPHVWGGLLVASVLHSVFNYLIIKNGSIIYTVVFLTIIGFFVLNDFEKLRTKKV